MSTTSIQQREAIKQGSVRVLLGDNFESLVDIGALTDPELNFLVENQSIEFDNTEELKKFVDGKKVQFTFNLHEINLTHLQKLDDGLIELETESGDSVTGEEQVVESGDWEYNKFIGIEKSELDIINSVTGGIDGVLTEGDDYYEGKNERGDDGIFIIDSAGVTTTDQTITINYDYTPLANKKVTFNARGTKTESAVLRIENINEDDKVFRIDIEKVTNMTSPALSFAADQAEEVGSISIEVEGELKEILDEQQPA